jgi:hypothetical protein
MMEIIQQIKKEAVYWSWGAGGHTVIHTAGGGYPTHKASNWNHHANAWIPHFVTNENALLKDHPGPYIGWEKRRAGRHNRISVYLRPFTDNKIVITHEDELAMIDSAVQMGYHPRAVWMSEIVLHDKDMNPLRHITDLLYPLTLDRTYEIVFDTNQVEMTP